MLILIHRNISIKSCALYVFLIQIHRTIHKIMCFITFVDSAYHDAPQSMILGVWPRRWPALRCGGRSLLKPLARGRVLSGTWRPTAEVQQRLFYRRASWTLRINQIMSSRALGWTHIKFHHFSIENLSNNEL